MNVSGTGPLKLTGSADAPLQNLKLFGKSVQNGTPSPDNPVAIENIGKVVTGKNLFNMQTGRPVNADAEVYGFGFDAEFLEEGKTYTISSKSSEVVNVKVSYASWGENHFANNIPANGSLTVTFQRNPNAKQDELYIFLQTGGTTYGNGKDIVSIEEVSVLNIQFELGSTATAYEPYKVLDRTIGVTVSKDGDSTQSQTLDISIPVYRKNLCSTNNLVFETSEQIKFAENIPAGDYILSASIESTDTDSTANLALFYCTDGSTKEVYLTRNAGARVSKAFTLTKEATRVRLYASEGHSLSSGDTSTWSDIQIEAGSTMTPFEPYFEPYGLPGIPVSSGENYTDADGQRWIADEINFAKGKYIQRVGRTEIRNIFTPTERFWNQPMYSAPNTRDNALSLTYYFAVGSFLGNANYDFLWTSEDYMSSYFQTIDELNAFVQEKIDAGSPIEVFYLLDTPIEHDLPEDLMEAWNPIKTYYPDTILDNDADAFMWAQYLSNDDIPDDSPYFDPQTEVGKYYKALARYSTEMPNPTCRESRLIRAILDPDYTLPFTVDETYSRAERYLWDILHNTQEMIINIPKSAKEKFLHMMIGGEVMEYPTVDNEVLFWMQRCVEMQMNINALRNGGRA